MTGAPAITPGDFNGNGVVDAADVAQRRGNFGLNGDSDGDSERNEFLVWQRNLGANAAAGTASAVAAPNGGPLLASRTTLMVAAETRSRSAPS